MVPVIQSSGHPVIQSPRFPPNLSINKSNRNAIMARARDKRTITAALVQHIDQSEVVVSLVLKVICPRDVM
jgi:hypothetical protein